LKDYQVTVQLLEKDLIEMNDKICDYDRKLVQQTNILLYQNKDDYNIINLDGDHQKIKNNNGIELK